jgi:hypothetical protein
MGCVFRLTWLAVEIGQGQLHSTHADATVSVVQACQQRVDYLPAMLE